MSEYIYGTDGHDGHWLTGEEIVRCRDCIRSEAASWSENSLIPMDFVDCKFWRSYENAKLIINPVNPDGFCAWGVRR